MDYVIRTSNSTRTYHLKVFLVVDSKLLLVVKKQVLRSSGECTTVKSPKEFLLPGQSDDVEFEFSPFETRGNVERYVCINTNDPTSQYIGVKLIAEIKEVFQWIVGPNSHYIIENAINGKPVTKRIAMKNVSGLPISILGDSVSSLSITVTMDKKAFNPMIHLMSM